MVSWKRRTASTHVDPRAWTGVDRCALWLGFVLLLQVFYLGRVSYLLSHPEVEPYFDRLALASFYRGQLAAALLGATLLVTALLLRRRAPDNRWLPHAANQLWWIWASIGAYAVGPVTTPVLGLVVLGGFVALLLFPRHVVLPAFVSGLLVLTLTTLAERARLIPYAPLFLDPPVVAGRLTTAYVVDTSAIAFVILTVSFALVSYLIERVRARERALLATADGYARTQKDLEQVMQSLRATEERFRQLAENAREVFWLVDVDTRSVLYLSPTFEALWCMPCADVYECPARFLERVHPEDRARVAERFGQPAGEAELAAAAEPLEYRLVRPDGAVRWVQVRSFPIRDGAGRIYRLGGLIEDTTERRAIEDALVRAKGELERRVEARTAELSRTNEHLRHEAAERRDAEAALRRSQAQLGQRFAELDHLYEHAPIGLAFQDTELRYVRINARLAAINGRAVEAHIGRTSWEIIPEIASVVVPIMRGVLESRTPALDMEVRGSTPATAGRERVWLTSYFPVQSPEGAVLGVSVVVQDISEIRWAEQRARQHLENLAHVGRVSTMGEMATGIAHELNQPLAAIVNYAFIGRRAVEDAADAATLGKIFDELTTQALRAGGIIQHLRAFVRKAHGERVTTSVNVVIEDVLTLLGSQLQLGRVEPVLEFEDALPRVHVDVVQIQQVVLNLVRNALDAMAETDPGQRRLTITSTGAGTMVEVAIRDAGAGLSAEDVARVFDPFYTTKQDGMGMGLAISRSIIEEHGGRLWAEANQGRGVTFRFTLPSAPETNGTAS